jgi:hypothetical protein
MVLVGDVRCCRNPIQKTDLRHFFRTLNCARGKSSPIAFPHYMRRAAEASLGFWLPLTTKSATCGRHLCCWATNWRVAALRAGSLAGTIGLLGYTGLLCCLPGRLFARCRFSPAASRHKTLVSYLQALLPR